jgi:hypothetical protein
MSRGSEGPVTPREARRKRRQLLRLLPLRLAAMDGRRAARTRELLQPSRPRPQGLAGQAREPLRQLDHLGFDRRCRRSKCWSIPWPNDGPPSSSQCLPGPRTVSAFRPSSWKRWRARRWLTLCCGSVAWASPGTALRSTTTAKGSASSVTGGQSSSQTTTCMQAGSSSSLATMGGGTSSSASSTAPSALVPLLLGHEGGHPVAFSISRISSTSSAYFSGTKSMRCSRHAEEGEHLCSGEHLVF